MKLYILASVISLSIAALYLSPTSSKRPIFLAPPLNIAKEIQ
ncbi:hypothetical protein [Phormidesmis sp. 146-33]